MCQVTKTVVSELTGQSYIYTHSSCDKTSTRENPRRERSGEDEVPPLGEELLVAEIWQKRKKSAFFKDVTLVGLTYSNRWCHTQKWAGSTTGTWWAFKK